MGIYQGCPFEHHNPDEPEGDRDRAVTPERNNHVNEQLLLQR